jgi:Cytochrome oxidase complex assembly protein 1
MEYTSGDTWWPRNRKWAIPVGILTALVLFVGVVLLIVAFAMRSGDAYKQGLAKAQTDGSVVEALGEPIEPGFMIAGSVSVSGPSGHADLSIPLSGPRGEGILYVKAEKEAGTWTMQILEVEVIGRPERIHLLNGSK